MQSGTGEIKVLMGFEQDAAGTAEAQPARPGIVLVLLSEAGEDGMPITTLTKAFFVDVVPCKGTSHGYAERALAHNVLSTGHQKVCRATKNRASSTSNTKAGTHIPTEIVYEESPVGDSNQSIQGQIRAIKDCTERQCSGGVVPQHSETKQGKTLEP